LKQNFSLQRLELRYIKTMRNLVSQSHARAALMKAGLIAFSRKSFSDISIREINELAGQRNRNALQYHFGSKQNLLETVVRDFLKPVSDAQKLLIDAVSERADLTLDDLMDIYIQPFIQMIRFSPNRIKHAKLLSNYLDTLDTPPEFFSVQMLDEETSSTLSERLEQLTPERTDSERRMLLVVSNSILVNTIADLARASEAGLIDQQDPMYRQILRRMTRAITALWT